MKTEDILKGLSAEQQEELLRRGCNLNCVKACS